MNTKITSITIGNDCNGLTYALENLVRQNPNSIISDNKISLQEWSNTMDVLIKINEKRKEDNKSLIFTGGTDKTANGYNNSFIVKKGEKIDFTESEINKIYAAMGVCIKNNQSNEIEKTSKEPIKQINYDSNGQIIEYIYNTFNENGKIEKQIVKDPNENFLRGYEIIYDDKNKISKINNITE